MISVRTPLGQLTHLATSMDTTRTFCGLLFSVGFDKTQELRDQDVPAITDLCRSCGAAGKRRLRGSL